MHTLAAYFTTPNWGIIVDKHTQFAVIAIEEADSHHHHQCETVQQKNDETSFVFRNPAHVQELSDN